MIKKPTGWENVRAYSDRKKLPVGAYVCRIKQAIVRNTDLGDQLFVLFDIEDGEYAGFYDDDYKSNQRYEKKWKGVIRYYLPKNDGSDLDEFAKSKLKGLISSVEKSNPGYTWNWDERTFAGKLLGIIYRNEEWEYNGKTGWTARPFRACSVDAINDGTFTIPDAKPLNNKAAESSFQANSGYDSALATASDFSMLDDDSQLPF